MVASSRLSSLSLGNQVPGVPGEEPHRSSLPTEEVPPVLLAVTERTLWDDPSREAQRVRNSQVSDLGGPWAVLSGLGSRSRKGKAPAASHRAGQEAGDSLLLQPHPPDHPVGTQDAFPGAASQPLDSSLPNTGASLPLLTPPKLQIR